MNNPPSSPLHDIYALIEDIQSQLALLKQKIEDIGPLDEREMIKAKALEVGSEGGNRYGTVIEGVFDGQNMVGPDGKMYTIPANYASKSKLVEGDILKLTITHDGSFIYKQIGPVERERLKGELVRDDEQGSYKAVTADGKSFRLLTASVTYYKGEPGSTVILMVPKYMRSRWAAVENILKDGETVDDEFFASEIDDPAASAEWYGGLNEVQVMTGEALLPDGSAGVLPPEHGELPPEQHELAAEEDEIFEALSSTTSPTTTKRKTSKAKRAGYADGSRPFIPPEV